MILFIDDERMFVDNYVEALVESQYRVQVESEIDDALACFEAHIDDIELVIMDIMIPLHDKVHAHIDQSKTMGGRRTGVELLRLMRELDKPKRIPVLILTNVAEQGFHDTLATRPADVRRCLRKGETLPSTLVVIVNEILGR